MAKLFIALLIISILLALICVSLYYELASAKRKLEFSNGLHIIKNNEYSTLISRYSELNERVRHDIESLFEIKEMTITYYAPLDPKAVEGICYSGDPNRTASGGRPIPGETVAAHSSIPFGTKIWVAGEGWLEVNDRGVGVDCVDIVVDSQAEAINRGRVQKMVIIYKGVE